MSVAATSRDRSVAGLARGSLSAWLMSVTIADRAGKCFPVHAHTQGYAFWKSGHVTIEEESPRAVVAKVRGPRTRDVRLEDDGGRLLVQCTCPARTFERPGCKHVWATLLEIDRRGALGGLRGTRANLPVAFLDRTTSEPTPTTSPPPTTTTATTTATKKKKKKNQTAKKTPRGAS
jgi:hypothetical protein